MSKAGNRLFIITHQTGLSICALTTPQGKYYCLHFIFEVSKLAKFAMSEEKGESQIAIVNKFLLEVIEHLQSSQLECYIER